MEQQVSKIKAFWAKFLRCSSNIVTTGHSGNYMASFLLLFFFFFAFPSSTFFCIHCSNCSGLSFLQVFLHILFCLVAFLLPYYLSPLPHQGSICKLEQVQQSAVKMIRELDCLTYEEKLRLVFIMERRWLGGGLIIAFNYVKMCYREECARFLEVQSEMTKGNGQITAIKIPAGSGEKYFHRESG